jgi:hypothetical protein
MSGAVSEIPGKGGLSPDIGVNLRYITNQDGFCKGMFPIEPKGDLIWADGLVVVPDGSGHDRMLAHYQRLKGLTAPLARGLAMYNDERDEFEKSPIWNSRKNGAFPMAIPSRSQTKAINTFTLAWPSQVCVSKRAQMPSFNLPPMRHSHA